MKAVNLKKIRKDYGASQEDIARTLDISISTYRAWEQEVNTPRTNDLIMLADFFGCTVDDLLGRTIPVRAEEGDPDFVSVPLYGKIAAGTPIEMIEADDCYPVPMRIMKDHWNAFLLEVSGQSMNRIFLDGYYVLVDPDMKDIEDNKPYAICVNGYDATVKRIRSLNNGFELVPDSNDPTYTAKVFNYNEPGTEEITVLGQVVWHTRPFEWEY